MQKRWGKRKGRGSSKGKGPEVGVSWISASNHKQMGWLVGVPREQLGVACEVRMVVGSGGSGRLEPLGGFEQRLMPPGLCFSGLTPQVCGDSAVRGAGAETRRLGGWGWSSAVERMHEVPGSIPRISIKKKKKEERNRKTC